MNDSRRLLRYLAVVIGISYALQGVIWLRGGVGSASFDTLAPLVMFVPGITALVFLRRERGGWRTIRWGIGSPRYVVYAAIIPAVMAVALVAAITELGLATSPHLARTAAGVDVLGGLFVLGKGEQGVPYFLLNLLLSAVALGVLNGVVTVGEEVGWRGYLQPRLLTRFQCYAAIAMLGIVWAHWHTPVILMGYNYPESPVLGALLLWPLTCICWSFLAAWLTLAARSIWPAVVLHGSVNAFLGGLVDGMTFRGPRLAPDLIVLAAWVLVALVAAPRAARLVGAPPP